MSGMSGTLGREKKVILPEDSYYDQGRRAEAILDHVLDQDLSAQSKIESQKEYTTAAEELQARPIIEADTGRVNSRLLFVTRDLSVLEPKSGSRTQYLKLAAYFDEVHIMVLIPHRSKDTHERVGDNCWTYQVHAPYWWRLPWAAAKAAYDALVFNGAARPDIIIGTDACESGLAAYFIGRNLARPVQLHISENPLSTRFVKDAPENKWRRRLARYVLKRVASVRTQTTEVKELIQKNFSNVIDISVLPTYYDFRGLIDVQPTTDIHTTYRGFNFIILTFCPVTADGPLQDVFTAVRSLLLSPGIGLVIVGSGPAKQLYIEKAQLLGIEKNVVFVSEPKDLVSFLKTADVLLMTDKGQESELTVLKAAAAGLPIIAYTTDLRNDLFKHGESALLIPDGEVTLLGQNLTKFINSTALRVALSRNAQAIAAARLIEDPETYYESIRDTIETVLVPPEAASTDTKQ